MITKQTAQHLAEVIHEIRGDWDQHGIVAAIAPVRNLSLADVVVAAVLAATTPSNRSPAIIAMAGEHWRDLRSAGTWNAERHPSAAGTNALCRHCCRPWAHCQSATAQALDPHHFLDRLQPVEGEKWSVEIRDQLVRTFEGDTGEQGEV